MTRSETVTTSRWTPRVVLALLLVGTLLCSVTYAAGKTLYAAALQASDGVSLTLNSEDGTVQATVANSGVTVGTLTVSSSVTSGTAAFSGETTMASATVSDLTATRVTFAGTSGALEDDAGLTYASGSDTLTAGSLVLTTDLDPAHGGTGASTLTDGGVLLGSGTDAVTAMAVLADGEMVVGDGTTDPVAESGATLRTSIGVGTGDSPQFTNLTLTGTLACGTAAFTGPVTTTSIAIESAGRTLGAVDNGTTICVDTASQTYVLADDGTAGYRITFALDTTGTLRIDPGGTDYIVWSSQEGAGEYVEATDHAVIGLVSTGTYWRAVLWLGTWAGE